MRRTSLKKIFSSEKQNTMNSCQEIGLEKKKKKKVMNTNTSGNGKL